MHVVLPVLAVAAVLSLGGVGASAALSSGGAHPHPVPTATPAPGRTSPVATPFGGAPSTVGPSSITSTAPAEQRTATADFAVTATRGIAWVQVIGPHGRVLYAGLLRRGHTLSYPQRPLTVTIGDAGAVRLVLHHHAHNPAGRRGAVLRLTVR